MPRTELPSGNWVEWNQNWMSGVRFAVKSAVVYETVVMAGNGSREAVQRSDAANDDRQRLALWREQITGWSWADKGIPVPKDNAAGAEVIWSVFDGPDFNAFAEATADLFDEVTAVPTRTARKP